MQGRAADVKLAVGGDEGRVLVAGADLGDLEVLDALYGFGQEDFFLHALLSGDCYNREFSVNVAAPGVEEGLGGRLFLKSTVHGFIIKIMSSKKSEVWRVEYPYFYREKTFSICKLPGHQSLKHLKPLKFRRPRNISIFITDSEKLPLIKRNNQSQVYRIPELEYPDIKHDYTIAEYSKLLDDRIRDEKLREK